MAAKEETKVIEETAEIKEKAQKKLAKLQEKAVEDEGKYAEKKAKIEEKTQKKLTEVKEKEGKV